MTTEVQLSRTQQLWLVFAVLAACAPIWFYLPWWAPVFGLLGIAWRVLLLFKGIARPSKLVMAGLSLALFVSVVATYMPPIGVEPMSAILTAGAGLKYLELDRRRSSLLLIYLCYFIAGIQLIFTQSVGMFAVTLTACLIILSAQNVILQDSQRHYSWRTFSWQPLRFAAKIMLVSIPLTLLIFIIAPRIPSFWVVPIQQGSAQTGISERMDPGSVAALGQSSAIAFRVDFEGDEIPPHSQLYWRGLIMSEFDGRSWAVRGERRFIRDGEPIIWPERQSDVSWLDQIERRGEEWRYDIYMEPSYRRYLFSLGAPYTEQRNIGLARDMTMVYQQPVAQQIKYQVTSYLNYRLQPERLDQEQEAINLYLPPGVNPRAITMVEQWREQGLSTDELIGQLMQFFVDNFAYTLEPPTYPGANSIDAFLFDGQLGFCEHFASATAMILRAAGVPARIVGGYQGGELNPFEDYLIVRQYDAHAWVEYWQEGRGWVAIDPTAAVARARIDQGFQDYFSESASLSSRFSLSSLRNLPFANWLRLQADSLNYLWVRWVVSYDSENQLNIFSRLLGNYSPARLGGFLALCFGLVIFGWWIAERWQNRPRALRRSALVLRRFRDTLAKAGVPFEPGTTIRQMVHRAVTRFPQHQDELQQVGMQLETLYYADEGDPENLSQKISELRLKPAG